VRIVDHSIYHGAQMLRDRHDEAPGRQFSLAEVYRAARANVHGRCPSPADAPQISLDGNLAQSRSRVIPAPCIGCRRRIAIITFPECRRSTTGKRVELTWRRREPLSRETRVARNSHSRPAASRGRARYDVVTAPIAAVRVVA
jgi:hypothetical protein